MARGRLLGGNLTALSAIVGSTYLPDFTGCVLFLEDVEEAPYRIDGLLGDGQGQRNRLRYV